MEGLLARTLNYAAPYFPVRLTCPLLSRPPDTPPPLPPSLPPPTPRTPVQDPTAQQLPTAPPRTSRIQTYFMARSCQEEEPQDPQP